MTQQNNENPQLKKQNSNSIKRDDVKSKPENVKSSQELKLEDHEE